MSAKVGSVKLEPLLVEIVRADGTRRIVEMRDPREIFCREFNDPALRPAGVFARPIVSK